MPFRFNWKPKMWFYATSALPVKVYVSQPKLGQYSQLLLNAFWRIFPFMGPTIPINNINWSFSVVLKGMRILPFMMPLSFIDCLDWSFSIFLYFPDILVRMRIVTFMWSLSPFKRLNWPLSCVSQILHKPFLLCALYLDINKIYTIFVLRETELECSGSNDNESFILNFLAEEDWFLNRRCS